MSDINFFAETTARGVRKKFGIKLDDRRRHMYVIGKTGMGKSQMLQNMAVQDIQAGHGVGIVDPHGELAEALLDYIPSNRINDVVYFNPADTEMPVGFNIMENVGQEERYFIASGLMVAFEKIWADVWSERMKYILNNALLALLEYPNATILGANRMLADKDYRKKVIDNVKDPSVKSFWVNEFAKYPERYREEATGAIQNKIGQFISNPLMRHIVGQTKSTFNMRDIMDNKKIFIVNLSKGRIGEDNTALLGTMLIAKMQTAAMSRVDIPEEDRNDFFFYIDEFQTFATPSFAGILSEARKYRLSLILAHQYIAQMDEVVRDAVFGNAGSLVCFRVGAADADFLEKEFVPAFLIEDLVNIAKYNIAIKLMIDGVASNAFSAQTLPPLPLPEENHREKIIRVSQERYGSPRALIEEKILRWSGMNITPEEIEDRPLFDAECAECHKKIRVSFEPDGKRPVYCKDCLPKKMRERDAARNRPIPVANSPVSSPIAERQSPPTANASERTHGTRPPGKSETTDRQMPTSGSAQRVAPKEVSLDEAIKEHSRNVAPRRQATRPIPPPVPRGSSDTPIRQSARPKRAATPPKPKVAVDLAGLRKTLSDVLPPPKATRGHQPKNSNTKQNDSGILKEGEEVNFN